MYRFVTRAESFLIPKIEENEVPVTCESRMEVCKRPMRKQRTMSHSPDITEGEFVPLNQEQDQALSKPQL
jgi:hypothetical protein